MQLLGDALQVGPLGVGEIAVWRAGILQRSARDRLGFHLGPGQQILDLHPLQNHTDGAGDRAGVGDDLIARRSNVVTAGRGHGVE